MERRETMDFIDECRQRQAELKRALCEFDQNQLGHGDELEAARFRRNAQKTISLYEEIIHLSNGESVGHA